MGILFGRLEKIWGVFIVVNYKVCKLNKMNIKFFVF